MKKHFPFSRYDSWVDLVTSATGIQLMRYSHPQNQPRQIFRPHSKMSNWKWDSTFQSSVSVLPRSGASAVASHWSAKAKRGEASCGIEASWPPKAPQLSRSRPADCDLPSITYHLTSTALFCVQGV